LVLLHGRLFHTSVRRQLDLKPRRNSHQITVIEKWQVFAETRYRPTRNRCILAYKFKTATGAIVDGTDEVELATWNRLKRGDDIRVYYLPDAPKINHLRLESTPWNNVNWAQVVIMLIVGSMMLGTIILMWRRA
jgi:hypothetical protein